MKSFTAALVLALAAAATAAPSSRLRSAKRQSGTCLLDTVSNNPSVQDIENAINQWNDDVNTVNAYLNDFGNLAGPDAIVSATQQVLLSAQDEPCQFATLTSNSDFVGGSVTAAFDCANTDLGLVFKEHVLDNLNTIIQNPSDPPTFNAAVGDINFFRCCNVLPDADILWRDSAEDNGLGLSVNTVAGRPDACASIDCTGIDDCKALDNGAFGK
ncbi:hypothetical protein LTR36_003272 [Oleoguttula mirabilis]|uniref:Uncharacterized protein n=1 Tax=Oleoguttula mirabilis TaxID=1507867 RepID=A0AAV9JXK9_9PEZI|nr:hypothetical protein LTR36_003272 [Oleoguttula mirabilis]